MSDRISSAERVLIDAAVASGRVQKIPLGVQTYCDVWDENLGRVVYKNAVTDISQDWKGKSRGAGLRVDKIRARRAAVKRLAEAGKTAKQIAVDLGWSLELVRDDLGALGFRAKSDREAARQKVIDDRRVRVAQMVKRGMTTTDIHVSGEIDASCRTIRGDVSALGLSDVVAVSAKKKRAGCKTSKRGMSARVETRMRDVARRFEAGESVDSIAAVHRVSRGTINCDLASARKEGLAAPVGTARGPMATRRARLLELAEQGLSDLEIARELGCSAGTLRSDVLALRDQGVEVVMGREKQRLKRLPRVRACIAEGLQISQMARRLGVDRHTIERDLEYIKKLDHGLGGAP